MKTFYRLAEGLTSKLLGNADAGACVTVVGCCCSTKGLVINCFGQCVKSSTCNHCPPPG